MPIETTFNSIRFWAECMNTHAGADNWYIAGGCAAWLHIDAYANKDAAHYETKRSLIEPADVEIGVAERSAATITERYGKMKVRLTHGVVEVDMQTQDSGTLATHRQRCMRFTIPPETSVQVYTPADLIAAYLRSGNEAKKLKRQERMAMLELIQQRGRIDAGTMGAAPVRPTLGSLLGGVKLKSTTK